MAIGRRCDEPYGGARVSGLLENFRSQAGSWKAGALGGLRVGRGGPTLLV